MTAAHRRAIPQLTKGRRFFQKKLLENQNLLRQA
jgi:hypothetical protein